MWIMSICVSRGERVNSEKMTLFRVLYFFFLTIIHYGIRNFTSAVTQYITRINVRFA